MSDDIETRPEDSNADAWHLFLSEYLDARANSPSGLTFMAVQIAEAIDNAERRGASSNLPCGHHVSCLVKSVESDSQFCGFCDIMSQRNDAETMEERYRSDRDSLRKALDDRHAADKKAWSAIMRATGKERGLPDNKEVVAYLVAEVERLEERVAELEQVSAEVCDKCGWAMKFPGENCRNCERDSLRAKLDRAKEALEFYACKEPQCGDTADTQECKGENDNVYCGFKARAVLSELSADAPAQQTQLCPVHGKPFPCCVGFDPYAPAQPPQISDDVRSLLDEAIAALEPFEKEAAKQDLYRADDSDGVMIKVGLLRQASSVAAKLQAARNG
jgi:ribosomal protein L40E